jgi:flagellar hook-basal body complex protein FliE
VVEAIAAAELTVQTVTAVCDRIVEAYQELIRMPM